MKKLTDTGIAERYQVNDGGYWCGDIGRHCRLLK